jgi:hypothetical protein
MSSSRFAWLLLTFAPILLVSNGMQVFGWGSGDALDHVGMPRQITFGGTTFKPCLQLYWSSSTDPVTAPTWSKTAPSSESML